MICCKLYGKLTAQEPGSGRLFVVHRTRSADEGQTTSRHGDVRVPYLIPAPANGHGDSTQVHADERVPNVDARVGGYLRDKAGVWKREVSTGGNGSSRAWHRNGKDLIVSSGLGNASGKHQRPV